MNATGDASTPQAWLRAIFRFLLKIAFWSLLIVGGTYALGRLKSVLIALLISSVFAYIMRPIAGWLARRRPFRTCHDTVATAGSSMGRAIANPLRRLLGRPALAHGSVRTSMYVRRVIATFYVLVLLFVAVGYSVKWTVNPFVEELKTISDNWDAGNDMDVKARFEQGMAEFDDWYTEHVSKELRDRISAGLKKGPGINSIPDTVATWLGTVASHVGTIGKYIVEVVLFPVLAFYFALDSRKLKKEFVGSFPAAHRRLVMRIIHDFNGIMFSFVVGQAILCTIAGVMVGLFLAALGVKYSLTLGLLAGFTRAIPVIGPIIGGIPIIGLVLATQGLTAALIVLAFFMFMHFAESKFLMPILIGERMKLHPVVIIVVLLIGEEFGGLLGMFFAAPVAALIRVLVRRYWLRPARASV